MKCDFFSLTFHWRIIFLHSSVVVDSTERNSKLNQLKFDDSSFESRTRRLSIPWNVETSIKTKERSPDPTINPIPMATCWDFYKLIRLEICNYLNLPSSPNVWLLLIETPRGVYKCVKIISFFERTKVSWVMIMIIKKISKEVEVE